MGMIFAWLSLALTVGFIVTILWLVIRRDVQRMERYLDSKVVTGRIVDINGYTFKNTYGKYRVLKYMEYKAVVEIEGKDLEFKYESRDLKLEVGDEVEVHYGVSGDGDITVLNDIGYQRVRELKLACAYMVVIGVGFAIYKLGGVAWKN